MGQSNYSTDKSVKEMAERLAAENAANGTDVDDTINESTIKKPMGYVDGYAQYIARYGGPVEVDGEFARSEEITNTDAVEQTKASPISKQVNTQVNQFRNIFGLTGSDTLEDPTFIIYDLYMDYGDSPLFNSVNNFFNEYSPYMEELEERRKFYEQFISMVKKIFPGDENPEAGQKRHYINSISGLDNLFKKIVTYPEDVLTFTLSEDITMLAQYISELYSNLVYSYDSHRYLIPDNLLRFNLTIIFRDAREMITTNGKFVNQGISKFAYVLHDCQFDFFNSRNFGSDVTVSGYDGGATTTPSTLAFNINYKSYSKIMAAVSIDDAKMIDVRERLINDEDGFNRLKGDYLPLSEQREKTQQIEDTENIRNTPLGDTNIYPREDTGKKKIRTAIGDYGRNIANAFTDEISDVRNVLVNKVKQEVTALSSQAQRAVSDAIFGGLNLPPGVQPLTLTKINVYYDDPATAINRVSFLFDNFLDNAIEDIKGNVNVKYDKSAEQGNRLNIYWGNEEVEEKFGEEAGRIATDALYPPNGATPRNSNVYDSENLSQGKAPEGDVHEDGTYNEKYPNFDGREDLHDDGTYNEKEPTGNVQDKGQYNEKYPDGDLHEDGVYNEKEPTGDVHEDGQYNEKEPLGSVQDKGQYNEKYPEGEVHEEGKYNENYPDGDVHEDGVYNEKSPEGDVHEDGQYNEKEPLGSVQDKGTYNEKFPEGDVHGDGTYNENYPDGDVHEDGQYNEKEPKGDVYGNEEPPTEESPNKDLGNVYGKKEEILPEEPEGDVHPDGEYNEKYPKGNLYKNDDDK